MRRYLLSALIGILAGTVLLAGCSSGSDGDSGAGGGSSEGEPVKVGSKIDTEGELLGQMIILMLEANDIPAEDRTKTGQTNIVRGALTAGEIDIYPEYTGTAINQFFPDEQIEPEASKNATESYETVRELDGEKNDIVWLERSQANNTFAIAIPKKLADGNAVYTMEDFAMYVGDGGEVKLAASQEFADREDGLPSFERTYGFELRDDQLQLFSGGNTAETEQAAARGTGGVNAAMAYGTDGSLAALDLVVLDDPKGAQAVFQPAPTVRAEVLERYPNLPDILDPVFASLSLQTLQKLNGDIATGGRPAREVAEEYLKAEGFLD